MSTKAQAIAALKKINPDAILIEVICPNEYAVQLEAPAGHHWDGDVHCRPVFWFASGNKPDFWTTVIEEIVMLRKAVPCIDDDCEGIAGAYGICEYWEED